jgi:agmatinase
MSWATIVDCGDVRMTPLDNNIALKQFDKAHQVCKPKPHQAKPHLTKSQIVSGQPASTPSKGYIPRIVVLGGDHTTTLSALRSTYANFGAVSVIHFDSHLDTWDPQVLGGELSHYA